MDIAASELMTRIAELGQNRANADVTLNCEGITIKAHSFILELRYENHFMKPQVKASSINDHLWRSDYFKTALNTNVGDRRNSVEVHECSHRVLSVIIDFMYGIALPEDREGYRFTKMTFLHVLLQIPLLWSIIRHFI